MPEVEPLDPVLAARMVIASRSTTLLWLGAERGRLAELDKQLESLRRVRDVLAAGIERRQIECDKQADNCHEQLSVIAAAKGADQLAVLEAVQLVLLQLENQEAADVLAFARAAKRLLCLPPRTPIIVSGCVADIEGGWLGRPLLGTKLYWNDEWHIQLRLQSIGIETLPKVRFSYQQLMELDVTLARRGIFIGEHAIKALAATLGSTDPQKAGYIRTAIREAGLE